MWPAIIGAVGALGSSIIGGIMNKNASDSAYSQSLEGMREQNAFNAGEAEKARQFSASEAQKTRDFQRQMELDSRFYNSAQNQVDRWRAAGLNPYLFNGDAGSAESLAGAQAASAQATASGAPSKQPVDFSSLVNAGMQGVTNAMALDASINETNERAELARQQGIAQEIQNEYAHGQNVLAISKTLAEIELTLANSKVSQQQRENLQATAANLRFELKRMHATYDEDIKRPKYENKVLSAQAGYYRAAKIAQLSGARLNAAKVSEVFQGIKESAARIDQIAEQKELTKQEVKVAIANEAKIMAEKLGVDNNNKNYPLIVRKLESEIERNRVVHSFGVPLRIDNDGNISPYQVPITRGKLDTSPLRSSRW